MKKLLIQLDSDKFPSSFDCVTAYDSGVDNIISYGGIALDNVTGIVYGAMFTRGGTDLKNTAIFVGGSDVPAGEDMLKQVLKTFFGPVRVSVMADPNGSNTTASAAVRKITGTISVSGKKAVVLGGTGPVGVRVCTLLAKEGAKVHLTSRKLDRAKSSCEMIKAGFNVEVYPHQAANEEETKRVLEEAQIIITTGVPGVVLVKEDTWKSQSSIEVMADVNAVPPLGIEGIKVSDNGKVIEGKTVFGGIGIGGLKMKIHHSCVAKLFERNDLVLDIEEIYEIAKGIS